MIELLDLAAESVQILDRAIAPAAPKPGLPAAHVKLRPRQ